MTTRHIHECDVAGCPHFYACYDRDCKNTWTCPSCEDDAYFDDMEAVARHQEGRQ